MVLVRYGGYYLLFMSLSVHLRAKSRKKRNVKCKENTLILQNYVYFKANSIKNTVNL